MTIHKRDNQLLSLQYCIGSDYIDPMGHMNVQFYSRLFDAATWAFFTLLGIDSAYIEEHHEGMAALEQRIQYFKEVRSGTIVQVWTQVRVTGMKTCQLTHKMRDAIDDHQIAQLVQHVVYFDLLVRKSRPIPETIRKRIEQIFNTLNE